MADNINELLGDKKFVEKILVMQTPEEIQKAFSDQGVKISTKELDEIAKNISQIINGLCQNEKITDNEAENISGSIDVHQTLRTAAAMIASVAVAGSSVCMMNKVRGVLNTTEQAINQVRIEADGVFAGVTRVVDRIENRVDGTFNRADQVLGNADQAVNGLRRGFLGRFLIR
jgi:hypothetical protein